ncbi:MAG TPA: TonB-dependent receptor [Bryobacteraceae bacterium]|nr:TonB-dependent receptor [Bryobacteraceae bacterium]
MRSFFIALVAFAAAAPLRAQSTTGAIVGTVTDQSDAAVPNAKLTATEVSSNTATETVSDPRGLYSFPALRPGVYRVEAEASGFRKLTEPNIQVRVDDRLEVNLKMVLGAVNESIVVSATAPLVESQTGAIGNVIENTKIVNLPLNQRNPYQLALLSPGVTPAPGFGNLFNSASLFMVNGNLGRTSEMLIDGITNSVPAANPILVVSLFPSPDAIEEFKMQTNSYAAEFGRAGGGIVNMVIKSGTNQFHGVLYEFLRNSKMDANDFFANRAGVPLASFKRNQFGFTVGGPVVHDHVFFFVNYEALRQRSFDSVTGTTPTALERSGDFSQSRQIVAGNCVPVQIFDPFTTRANPAGGYIRDPFPDSIIPASRFDTVGKNIVKYFPNPTSSGAACTGSNNFLSNLSTPLDTNEVDAKFDWVPSEKTRMSAGLGWRSYVQDPANHYGNIAAPTLTSDNIPARSLRLEYNRTQSATLLLQVRFGITRLERYYGPPAPPAFTLASLGFPPGLEKQMQTPIGFPVFSFSGYVGMGKSSQFLDQRGTAYTWDANATKIAGRHQVKAGLEFRINQSREGVGADTSGTFGFDRTYTQGPNPTAPGVNLGNPIASLLLGVASSGQAGILPAVLTSNPYLALYVQDDFRVSPKLTLNLGLRWDLEPGRTERYNQLSYFDFNAPSPIAQQVGIPGLHGGLRFVDVNGDPSRQFDTQWNRFAPRFSFAYSVNPKTVIRGGYGVFFLPFIGAASGWASGVSGFLSYTPMVTSLDGLHPADLLSNPFPKDLQRPAAPSIGLLASYGQDLGASGRDGAVDRSTRDGYSQQWNFNVQRQLPEQISIEAAYVGNKGTKLPDGTLGPQLNQLTPDQLTLGNQLLQLVSNPFQNYVTTGPLSQPTVTRAQLLRPYPQFLTVYDFRPALGSSIYHAFQARLEKRFSSGLTLLGSFTGGKLIDNVGGVLTSDPSHQNIYNLSADRALAPEDISRRFVLSYVYDLPFGRGKQFGSSSSRPLDLILGNWSLNGILTFSTGVPLVVLDSQNNSQSFSAAQRPNVNGNDPNLPGGRPLSDRLAKWFDTSVFSQPAAFTFGNASRTMPNLRADGIRSWDFSVFKAFPIHESIRAEFRAEMFNFTNTPNFAAPGQSFGSATFGVVNAQSNSPRQVQLGLKLYY